MPHSAKETEGSVCGKECDHGSPCLLLAGHESSTRHETQHGCVFYSCECCHEASSDVEEVAPDTGRPGGLFCKPCVEAMNEPECSCYESVPGHMPGCPADTQQSVPVVHEDEVYCAI